MLSSLFKVVSLSDWQHTQKTDTVPLCASDRQHGHIHLNQFDSLEQVTNHYFSEQDQPLALRIDPDAIADSLSHYPPSADKPWPQPCANIDALTLSMVTEILHFDYHPESGFTLQP